MPLVVDDELKAALADGRISAVSIDTNIFDAQHLNFKSPVMKAITSLKDIPFSCLLSGTVSKEVQRHLTKAMEDAQRSLKKAAGEALFAFDTAQPTRGELLDQVTRGQTPKDAATSKLGTFLEDCSCEVLDDVALVSSATLFDAYFENRPPFGSGGAKVEFPDALALHALEKAAEERQTAFLVVSEDSDWSAYCSGSGRLYLVKKIEKALSLINNTPLGLRNAVVAWCSEGEEGRAEIEAAIRNLVEVLDVNVTAYASTGEVEAFGWAPEVRSIDWPDSREIDVIESDELEDGSSRLVLSVPMLVRMALAVELNFSFWDSVDKESVGMGGRTIELERAEEIRVTITVDVSNLDGPEPLIVLHDTEIDSTSVDVDLDEVDAFEPEDRAAVKADDTD